MILSSISGIPEPYNTEILSLFETNPNVSSLILFGSRAKGNYREGSDIDLAVKGKNFNLNNRDDIQNSYSQLNIPWKLDIVIYSSIQEPLLQEHIDRVGVCLIKK